MNKQSTVYSYIGILAMNQEWNLGTCNNMNEPQERNTKWNKPDKKAHIVLFQVHKMPRLGRPTETESRQVVARAWGREELKVTAW